MAHFGFDHSARRISLVAGLLAVSLLMGCASKLNPFNWFGPRAKTVAEVSVVKPSDPRPLIASITKVQLENVPSGALITATGQGAAVGSWSADLVALPVQDGILTLEFRAWPAPTASQGSPRMREVTAGRYLSRKELVGLTQIIVQGEQNSQRVRP